MQAAYLHTIMSDMLAERSALVVLARGLGMHLILRRLVEAHHKPEHLVLVLNTSHEEERMLLHGMAKAGDVGTSPPAIITNECSAQERMELYLAGGVVLVTARILIVDLLSDRVPVQQATGVVVANAHRVTESSIAFIMRIFRQCNKTAFIYALSDDAHGFTRGFARVEKVMRMLHVRRLQLWPRFHLGVSSVLDQYQPHVEELTVPLSARAARLQQALLQAVDECLRELRGLDQSVDVSQLTVESTLFKSFDTIVRMQLEPIWHRVSRRTKALVQDLQTLRRLLNYLVAYDCVSYFECLESIFDAASSLHPTERPHWILNSSESVWQLARDRVYELQRTQQVLAPPPPSGTPAPAPAPAVGMEADGEGAAAKRQRVSTNPAETPEPGAVPSGPSGEGGVTYSRDTAACRSEAKRRAEQEFALDTQHLDRGQGGVFGRQSIETDIARRDARKFQQSIYEDCLRSQGYVPRQSNGKPASPQEAR